jgi:hypothetical protein
MIRRLTKPAKQLNYGVYDLEWYPDTLQLRLLGVKLHGRFKAYTDVRDFFLDILTPENSGITLFAHYGGRFDIVHLFSPLLRAGYRVDCAFSGSAAVRVIVSTSRYSWVFADSQFLFKTSLAALGKSVGLEKGSCSFDAPLPELIEYNERDCDILDKALSRAIELMTILGGQLRFTLASTALDLFRRRYLRQDIPTQRTLNRLFRAAYVASRVEPLRETLSDGHSSDINSSFPYSMKSEPLPGKLLSIDRQIADLCIFEADVTVPECFLPPLPYRHLTSVYFPTGSWRGWYSTPDAALLERCGGRIERVYQSYHFEPQTDLADYVTDVYGLRVKETDEFWVYFLKILLNALYGKFGEREEKERILINPDFTSCPHDGMHVMDGVSTCMRMIRPGIFAIKDEREIAHCHLPIPILTTARSRALIAHYVMASETPAYLDTDCVWSKTRWPSSKELGQLKYEFAFRNGHFLAPKAYAAEAWIEKSPCPFCRQERGPHYCDVVRMKGFPKMSRADFDHLAAGGSIAVDRFRGPRTALRIGIGQDSGFKGLSRVCAICGTFTHDTCPAHGARVIVRSRMLPKRCHLADGSSRPWSVDELTTQ